MKREDATKESAKFTLEVVTGRHKIYRGLDQIATADDGESAQLIIDALNERERLREALQLISNYCRTCPLKLLSTGTVTRRIQGMADAALNVLKAAHGICQLVAALVCGELGVM